MKNIDKIFDDWDDMEFEETNPRIREYQLYDVIRHSRFKRYRIAVDNYNGYECQIPMILLKEEEDDSNM